MGCLKSILKKIFIALLIFAFFAFGGYAFVKDKIKRYQYPPRDVFVEQEIKYGNFENVSGDYQLYRSYNFFGYKKINAKYLPTGQKITIFDLKDEDMISVSDFYTGEIDNKIKSLLNVLKDSLITYENFEIINKGQFQADNKEIPYLVYKTDVKNLPFKHLKGTICAYTGNDVEKPSTRIIFSVVNEKAYNEKIVKDFVSAIGFDI